MLKKITSVYTDSHKRYGSPRVMRELRKRTIRTSKKRVARLMSANGMHSVLKKKFKATTNSNHGFPVADNVLQQNFTTDAPNKVWTSDITYIWTSEGWLYLAVVLDIYGRRIVGWKTDTRLRKEIVTQALEKSIHARRPNKDLVFHSDRGVQYASTEVRNIIAKYSITQSMSAKGNCYDNAITESFFHTLKTELIYQRQFATRQEAELCIFEYIEVFYNRQRLHSSIGYMAPVEYENQYYKQQKLSLRTVN